MQSKSPPAIIERSSLAGIAGKWRKGKEAAMAENELQDAICRKLGLRVGPEVAEYLRQQARQSAGEIPVMAADARTGMPIQAKVTVEALKEIVD
jgi:hypothetical protein